MNLCIYSKLTLAKKYYYFVGSEVYSDIQHLYRFIKSLNCTKSLNKHNNEKIDEKNNKKIKTIRLAIKKNIKETIKQICGKKNFHEDKPIF